MFASTYFAQGYPSRIFWGVDSVTHADAPESTGKFFDLVTNKAGDLPCERIAWTLCCYVHGNEQGVSNQ